MSTASVLSSCSNQDDYDYNCPCCNFYKPSYAILFPWVIAIVGVGVNFLLIQVHSPVPYAALMFLFGTALGTIATISATGCCNTFILSTLQWTQIDSNVLLITLLPGLILRDAMEVQFDLFMLASGQLLILAYPMVLLGTVLTATAAFYCVPWFDWPWSLTLTLGSILGTTDPIAVASVLKTLGAPPRLQLHLSGESTLNDGSAMVFFNIFSQLWINSFSPDGEDISIGRGFALFFQNALGGFAVGLCFAIGLLGTLYYLDKRLEPDYDILQAAAAVTCSYLSFYVADQLLKMSGVTASVTCAVLAKSFGNGMMQDGPGMIRYLSLMEFLLNTLLFALGGVVWGANLVHNIVSEDIDFSGRKEWLWLFVMYLFVMIIRAIQVGTVYPIFQRIGLRSNWREALFLSFAGMRGAVGIALSLSLWRRTIEETPDDSRGNEIRSLASSIFFIAGGVSLCTLLINGTIAPWILQWLNLLEPSDRKGNLDLFEVSAKEFLQKHCSRLLKLQRFQGVSFPIIRNHVLFVPKNCLEEENQTRDPPYLSGNTSGNTARGGMMPHRRMESTVSRADSTDIESFFHSKFDTLAESIHSRNLADDDVNVENDAASSHDALYMQIRHLFLDLVYHTFVERLQEGYLDDDREQNIKKKLKDIHILMSFEHASEDEANFGESLRDRELMEMPLNLTETFWWNRLERMIRRWLTTKYQTSGTKRDTGSCQHGGNQAEAEYRAIRPTIQRTVAFIGAHRRAEEKFRGYMDHVVQKQRKNDKERSSQGQQQSNEDRTVEVDNSVQRLSSSAETDKLEEVVEMILQESQEQTVLALEKLKTYPQDTVRKVQSHVMASILLKRLARFVATNIQEGTLSPTEAQVYLDMIEEKKEGLKSCSGSEVLGSTESVNLRDISAEGKTLQEEY